MNDLDAMSVEDLRSLRRAIDKALSSFQARQRKAALAAVEEAARQHGYTMAQLVEKRSSRSSARPATTEPGTARYANPENPSETWTGRGRRPHWAMKVLETGGSLEDLAI